MKLKTPFFKRARKLLSARKIALIISTFVLLVGTTIATISSTDNFIITVDGEATTMASGETMTFTIRGVDSNGEGRAFSETDYVFVELMNSWPTTGHSTTADITAVGEGITIAGVGSGENPYPLQDGNDISGANDNTIKFNLADGTAVTNTITVTATSSFEIFVWAPGSANIDPAERNELTLPGSGMVRITVESPTTEEPTETGSTGSTGSEPPPIECQPPANQPGLPPVAWLSYPLPGSWDIPTNISCINVDFDRPMDATTLTTNNIYLKKMENGAESDSLPSGPHTITATDSENRAICISGYTLEPDSHYRVVITRDVKDTNGNLLAGMPIDENGNPIMGFGFENMGPFKESFHTGSGSQTVTASIQGINIDKYNNGTEITGVPVGVIIRANFNAPLSASTINATNVTLIQTACSVPVPGNVYYDSKNSTVEFVPNEALIPNTSYTFGINNAVTSNTGEAITAISGQFTTGPADSIGPQVAFTEADNYGIFVHFNEPMNATTAENLANYTLKTCSGQSVNADGIKCADNITDPTPISLLTWINARYERMGNLIMMHGLTLTPGDGYYIEVSNGVLDMAGNGVDASNNSWTGRVMDASKFQGGQGMFTMGNIGFEDMDMGMIGMKPINVMPMNNMANVTTKYFVNFPVDTQIPAGGYVELTFPSGFSVTGVKRDAQSPMNRDFNGSSPGTITFANNITGLNGFTDGTAETQPNDGIGYIEAAGKVGVKLSAQTQASDFIHFDLDGITNTSEPKDFDTAGYTVQIKTYDASGALLEAKTSMPFFISASGTNRVSGRITDGATGLNGVKVFLSSPTVGYQETVTANNAAGGNEDGEYKFSNLPSGEYMIFTEPMFTVGATEYYGQQWPEPLQVSSDTVKHFTVTPANQTNGATQPVSITFPDLSGVSNLGFNDSIDIFAGGPNGFVVKTVSRATLGTSPYTTNLFLPHAGDWVVGIRPAQPKGPTGQSTDTDWMSGSPTNIQVNTADIAGSAMPSITIPITIADKTLNGKVVDSSGTAIANAEVFAYSPKMGKNTHAKANSDGTFSLPITVGNYQVGAFLPGMPPSQEVPVEITDTQAFVGGTSTPSTGSAGGNPFILKIAKPDLTIQGRVSDGTNPIANAAVWAHRTDNPAPPVNGHTNQSGNYTLYISAGTWKVEADAPGFGYLGSKTLTVESGTSLTGQNFTVPSTNMGTIQGTVGNHPGAIVWAWGPNGDNGTKTNSTGAYSLIVPHGTYTVEAFVPGVGDMPPLTNIVVDGDETGNNFTVGTAREFTVTIKDDQGANTILNEDTIIEFFNATGKGNNVVIPAGRSVATAKLTEGEYYIEADVPGVPFGSLVISGAEFNNVNETPSTDNKIEIDGTEDEITITLPAMFTVSGQVTANSNGVNNAFVNVFNTVTKKHFGVMTSSNSAGGGQDGEYTIKIPAGTYKFVADKPGSSSTPVDVTISADTTGKNLTITANSRTITGTVTNANGNPIANAHVWAEDQQESFGGAETSADGTFTIPVKESEFTVKAVAEGYAISDAVTANTTSENVSGLNFSLTALTGGSILKQPKTEPIIPISGGTVIDDKTNTTIIVPPSALGTGQDAGQIITKETNAIFITPTSKPIGNGQVIEAIDHNGNPINTLNGGSVKFQLTLTTAELALEGITTATGVDQITNGYWDESINNWVTMPTTKTYYDANNNIIPKPTVAGAQSLATANVDHIVLTSNTDHFTTFAPILPSQSTTTEETPTEEIPPDPLPLDTTPPAAPTGLSATPGNKSVSLSWTANSESDMSYYIIWDANMEKIITGATHSSCLSGTCTKTVSRLTNGNTYSFQIIAVDKSANKSDKSTAVSAIPDTQPITTYPTTENYRQITNPYTPTKYTPTKYTPTKYTPTKETQNKTSLTYVSEDENEELDWGDDEAVKKYISENTKTVSEDSSANVEESNEEQELAQYYTQLQSPFADTIGHWGEAYIADLFSRGIISGYDETTFAPDNAITRAEFTKIAIKMFSIVVINEITESPFTDVSLEDWFATFVATAKMAELVGGYEDGTFKPNQPINRAEAMKILLTAAGADISPPTESMDIPTTDSLDNLTPDSWDDFTTDSLDDLTSDSWDDFTTDSLDDPTTDSVGATTPTPASPGFPDVAPEAWYAGYVNFAAQNGMVSGYEDGTFGPENNMTRAEVSKIASLMIQKGYTE